MHALSLPGHPLRVTEKATHGEQMGLYSWHSRMRTSITNNIVPKCEVCPGDHGKVVESLRGYFLSGALATLLLVGDDDDDELEFNDASTLLGH